MDDFAEQRQDQRAVQYAVCTYALEHDRVTDGAEGIFDQAVTNGLAAIVAHAWAGAEMTGSRVRSARELLDVIEQRGKAERGGIVRVPHDPDGPEFEEAPFADEPLPNFTTVRVPVLRDAINATQAIRHARVDGHTSAATLSDEHVAALRELDYHPALFALGGEAIERSRMSVRDRDIAEQQRAAAYYHELDADERARRQAIDYRAEHEWEGVDCRTAVQRCPVCGNRALVARTFDAFAEEIGIGTCLVCSYRRTREVADECGVELDIERAIERAMERDD
jgi:hypothetical protein